MKAGIRSNRGVVAAVFGAQFRLSQNSPNQLMISDFSVRLQTVSFELSSLVTTFASQL